MLKILLADNSVLTREGFKHLAKEFCKEVSISEVTQKKELIPALKKHRPSILVIDPAGIPFLPADVVHIKTHFSNLHILAISPMLQKEEISLLLHAGVTSFLLKECDQQEICDAIENTKEGKRFLCGQIVEVLTQQEEVSHKMSVKKVSCGGIVISDREIEIIKHIALGLSNKQIAEKLFLSFHTVHTHRKNVMQKLGVNNTAGVVMFAVKNNLLSDEKLPHIN
ncbi:MAG: response regulator transcription factor [Bacteroidetes bacterium]|nr:response regulator transcription factor [Bacteroidota bacterium]